MEMKMRGLKSALFAVALGLGAAPSYAADPNVASLVTPVPAIVTYSRVSPTVLTTYAAYEISITNNSTNVLNNVRVEGFTDVVGSTQDATFVASVGLTCSTTNPALTAISCSIGKLLSGGSASFVVVFKTPTAGSSIEFAWTNYFSEGANDNGAHNDTNSGTASTTLGTPTATEVKSFALPGDSFFTGQTGIASPADAFTTKVTVPAYAKAEVVESTFTTGCTNFLTCWQTDLTIPGTFSPYLTVVVSQDKANIKPGTKIGSVVLEYKYFDVNNVLQTYIVGACASPTTPLTNGLPCIASSVHYKKGTPGWTADLDGDFVWTLISLKNGRITIY
jgi:hypothetical protein